VIAEALNAETRRVAIASRAGQVYVISGSKFEKRKSWSKKQGVYVYLPQETICGGAGDGSERILKEASATNRVLLGKATR